MRKFLLIFLMFFTLLSLTSAFNFTDGSLVAYYPMNETTGTVRDVSMTGHDGQVGNAFNFDGVKDYVDIGDLDIHDETDFTINLWVKGTTGQGFVAFYAEASTASNNPLFQVSTDGSDHARIYYRDDTNTVKSTVDSTTDILDGTWHMITAVYEGTGVTLYIDKNSEGTDTFTRTTLTSTETSLGGILRTSPATSLYNGALDEVGIWNKALNQTEINSIYNNQKSYADLTAGEKTNLVSYYSLDEVGSDPLDSHGSNDGELSGGTNNGATRGATGKIENAFDFDGINDNISVGNLGITADWSFSFWASNDSNAENRFIAGMSPSCAGAGCGIVQNSNEMGVYDGATLLIPGIDAIGLNFYTFTKDGTNYSIYVNGSYETSATLLDIDIDDLWIGVKNNGVQEWPGIIDEVGIWNRALNSTEISELYNSGDGLGYSATTTPTVTLVSPANDSSISEVAINFTATGNTLTAYNWTNATFNIWRDNGTIFNSTTISFAAGNSSFSETLQINSFDLDDYVWNVEACYNGTAENCTSATANYTFSVAPFTVLDEDFLATTLEGSTDLFTANLSFLSGQRLSEIAFFYNGTSYTASATEYSSGLYFVSRTHDIPLVSTDTNVTFYWNVTLESGQSAQSPSQNQTILDFGLDNCTTFTNTIFNFTMVDEDTQALIAGVAGDTNIKVDFMLSRVDGEALPINLTFEYDQINPARVCGSDTFLDSQYRLDALVEYVSTGRFIEFYNIQNFLLTNTTSYNNVTLYNLNSTSPGQEFKITYKNALFNTVPGALVQIQRKYIEEGVFKTVEIPKISSAGYTIAHLIRNDVVYNLIVTQDDVVIDSFENIVASCQNPSFTECEININSFSASVSPIVFSSDGESFSTTLTYNETTREVEAVFAITTGVPSVTTLNVTLFDSLGNTTVCSDSLNAAGGTLSCTVPSSFGNSSIVAKVINNGEVKKFGILRLDNNSAGVYGASIVFLSLAILLLVIGMGITDNPLFLAVMLIIGVIIITVMNITYTMGWIGSGATILWLIIGVIIILVKGANR